ncbi:TNF receptor-associated factor 3-like isoform X2 [Pecten maximus]|uniref:TNF receptor-associated factor 3-like isoform X2 n=1 Tax=Pecten maximus TaxID=6579 RepID=UPI001458E6F7|nr:TNF receptor-associated factor 3-like isoform X2 [Pecten maximus]
MNFDDKQSSLNLSGPPLTLSSTDRLTGTLGNLSLSSSLGTPEDTPEFVQLDPSCYCVHCKLVVREALQLLCGHHVCLLCLDPLFGDEDVKICSVDDCGYQISKSEVFPDTFKRREVLKQKVYCTFRSRGCDAIAAWKDLKNHVTRCEFALVPCVRAAEGCTALLPRDMYDSHVRETCDFLPVTCNSCQTVTLKGKFQAHIEKDCPKAMISCPFSCGTPKFFREQLDTHREQCPNKPNQCSFSSIGCEFKGTLQSVQSHEKDDLASHLQLLSKYTSAMERRNADIMTELSDLRQEKAKWHQHAKALEEQCNLLKKENSAVKKSEKELTGSDCAPRRTCNWPRQEDRR